MSFIPSDLDSRPAQPAPADLLSAQLPAQAPVARSFSDPSYLMEINAIREKVKAGTATRDDMKRAISLIRETRGAVSSPASTTGKSKSASSRAKATPKAKPDGQALLDLL